MRPWRAVSVLLGALLVACSAGGDATTTTSSPVTTAPGATTTAAAATTSSTIQPVGDVQEAIDRFVDVVNGDDITAEEYEAYFSPVFREQVPFEPAFQSVITQLRPGAPYTVVERQGTDTSGEAIVENSLGERLLVTAELDGDGLVSSLLVQPAEMPALEDPPDTIEEAFRRLAELGETGAVAAEVADGSCEMVAAARPEAPVPIGSVFKLYVLAAVGESVDAGDISWDDELVISDELKSIPTGVLQDRPDGTTVTVAEAAELMISISDNTATDHLIDLVGRQDVEAVMVDYGNDVAELSTPMPTTRELAALKVGVGSGLSEQWVSGGPEERRAILDQLSGLTPGDIPVAEWVDPILPGTIEWFATPSGLCRLAIEMEDLVSRVPEVGDILEMNPGVPAAPGTWDRIWFKGGSEPGMLAAWFRTESEGRVFVTAGSVVDPETTFDQTEAMLLLAAARDLLAP